MRAFQYSESANVRKHALGPVVAMLPVLSSSELFDLPDFLQRALELLGKGHKVASAAVKLEIFESLGR